MSNQTLLHRKAEALGISVIHWHAVVRGLRVVTAKLALEVSLYCKVSKKMKHDKPRKRLKHTAQPRRHLILNDLDLELDLDVCRLTFNANKQHAMSTLYWGDWSSLNSMKHAQSIAFCFITQATNMSVYTDQDRNENRCHLRRGDMVKWIIIFDIDVVVRVNQLHVDKNVVASH